MSCPSDCDGEIHALLLIYTSQPIMPIPQGQSAELINLTLDALLSVIRYPDTVHDFFGFPCVFKIRIKQLQTFSFILNGYMLLQICQFV